MRVVLSEQKLCVTGNFTHFQNKGAVERAIRAAGGATTSSLALSTTGLVLGAGYAPMREKAQVRGLIILDEEQLRALLEHGFVEVADAAQPEEAPRDALISELRPTIGAPSSASWDAIIEQVDRCPADQLPELVSYVEAQIARWRFDVQAQWHPNDAATARMHRWRDSQPRGELRCAPMHWITEMLRGEGSAKHSLVRAISLEDLGVKNADVIKLLKLEQLENLRYLDLGHGNKYSPNMWKTLRNAPATKHLEHLRIAEVKDAHLKEMRGEHHLDKLRHVTLHYYFSKYDEGVFEELFKLPWFQQLDTLTLEEFANYRDRIQDDLLALPHVKHLNIDAELWITPLTALMGWHLPFEEVSWVTDLYMPEEADFIRLCAHPPSKIARLDLSQISIHDEHKDDGLRERLSALFSGWLLKHLPGSALMSAVPAIKLGRWWTQELADALAAHNTDVQR
jgi:hypothetical protein